MPDSKSTPLLNLLYVNVQTFTALGLGYICVRLGFVDKQRGDMRAVQFFVGKIALPLCCFKVVATSDLGELQWGAVLACNLAKAIVFVALYALSYCAYKRQRSKGQRILTSTIFGFFVVASNDFAIGLPVIKALYGDRMVVYIAANVFIFQTVIQPCIMILFEFGIALRNSEQSVDGESSEGQRCRQLLWASVKGVASNAIILAALVGFIFQAFCHSTVRVVDGERLLPHPLYDIVTIITQPFTMLFLFINGAALTSADIRFWSVALVLGKCIACAYISYALACVFVPNHAELQDFAFFYGSIPAGGAPLILASTYDSEVVPLVASASLFCLILAGPVEFMTATFLGTHDESVRYTAVHQVQQVMASCSFACGAIALLLMAILKPTLFSVRIVAFYGVVVTAFATLTLAIPELHGGCDNFALHYAFVFLQNAHCMAVIFISYRLFAGEGMRQRAKVWWAIVVVLACLVPPFITSAGTWHELCERDTRNNRLMALGIWRWILLLATVGPGVGSRISQNCSQSPQATAGGGARLNASFGLASSLVVLQVLRLLMEIINDFVMVPTSGDQDQGFTPMLILVNVLEHGQGCILLAALMLSDSFLVVVSDGLVLAQNSGIIFRDPEMVGFTDPDCDAERPVGRTRTAPAPLTLSLQESRSSSELQASRRANSVCM